MGTEHSLTLPARNWGQSRLFGLSGPPAISAHVCQLVYYLAYATANHHEISILTRMRKNEGGGGYPSSPRPEPMAGCPSSNELTSLLGQPSLEAVPLQGHPTSGGVTASTEMLAAKRHAGVHTPVIVGKMIIANQQMAYAA